MTSFSALGHNEQLAVLEKSVRAELTRYGIDAGADMTLQQYEDNAVWRIDTPGQPYVARLSVRAGRTVPQQKSEMRWLTSLAETEKVAVPSPITTTAGEPVLSLDIPGHPEEATLAILHWVPGTAEPDFRNPTNTAGMGAATAHLHHNAATVDIPFDRPHWNLDTILTAGAATMNPAARANLGENGRATLQAVGDQLRHAMAGHHDVELRIHGDLHRENMIAMPDGAVGIIDFDDCGWGNPILDIATVLSSIHRIAEAPGEYEKFYATFIDGYSRIVSLPDKFEQLLEPFLVLRDVFVLNFVSEAMNHNAEVASWGPGRIAGILDSMREYLSGSAYPGTPHR
ncbi:phosphotransferase enzyme family protein [Nocardia xishanensis]|uniref:Phosphotransferase enzyme family protein n=1 Tax=Nocardia xishanensis TaxID=238964 RepID=A0ABW7WW51_9NOCA